MDMVNAPHSPQNIAQDLKWIQDTANRRRLFLSQKASDSGFESAPIAIFGQIRSCKCSVYGNCSVDYLESVGDMDSSKLLKAKMTWYLQVRLQYLELTKGTTWIGGHFQKAIGSLEGSSL